MSDKINMKKEINKNNDDSNVLIEKKIAFFHDVIQKTIIHIQKNKTLDILGISDVGTCIEKINELVNKLNEAKKLKSLNGEGIINALQNINNELSTILKNYGTHKLEDLLLIIFGTSNKMTNYDENIQKYELLKKYFHPISYKVLSKKDEPKISVISSNKIKKVDETIDDKIPNLACYDVINYFKQFHMKVYGIKIHINSEILKKSLVIYGYLDEVVVDFINNSYIANIQAQIKNNKPTEPDFQSESFDRYISMLTLKDYLMYINQTEIYGKFAGFISQNNIISQKAISHVVKEFISDDIYGKRNTLINLLIKPNNYDNQYLAYLLYDLLSNDVNGNVDSQEQTIIFDSFSWPIKQNFKQAMKKTIQYTNELSNFDINKIPLEQQICLLKASDTVKEKAMTKLKEVKAKSEDTGSKARQYLDGLIKLPFGIYRKEPILNVMDTIKSQFKELYKKFDIENIIPEIPNREKFSSIEVVKYTKKLQKLENNNIDQINKIKNALIAGDKKTIVNNITLLNAILKKHSSPKIRTSQLNKDELIEELDTTLSNIIIKHNQNPHQPLYINIINDIINEFKGALNIKNIDIEELSKDLGKINDGFKEISDYMTSVKSVLDDAVHGHDKAKKQIERIVGQWINGEQDGYCFGFEGPPGLGKTSLAKRGLSNCLKDENGNPRPFAMIQMGGDSNGSTLHGHNYTYVGSTWGSIVQILMDKKCLNPIIFIDEVDKISRTEHGKEIVGILTHLLDPAQNDVFQDKYFTGIDIDLSKALFVLSYNDVEAIDKILLDRVHRIKFNSLTLEEKIVISNSHLLPEIYKKMGLENMIFFSDEVLKFVIDEYTCESGVRKLKEILFEIVAEINLDVLKNNSENYDLPINITINDIKTKYFKDKHEIKHKKIHEIDRIGVINGLWANALGKGGVIPIQADYRPSEKFLQLHLTGMQGDVMKESMSVALTLAWNLTDVNRRDEIWSEQSHSLNGVHIHCPETSTPKDGPSAGTAITTAIYSLFNNKKIKYNIAITGEICLNGNVTEIGGLDLKILGAIKAGVKEIIFPKENTRDYDNFMDKYRDTAIIKDIKFYPVSNINEVFKLVFV